MSSSAVLDVWETIAADAAAESQLWAETLRPEAERERDPVFSPLAEERFALGLETIYEGYLVHYGIAAPVRAAPTRTRRCCSATICTRTGSCASPRSARSTRWPTWRS